MSDPLNATELNQLHGRVDRAIRDNTVIVAVPTHDFERLLAEHQALSDEAKELQAVVKLYEAASKVGVM